MAANDDRGNDRDLMPTPLRPGDLQPEGDEVRAIRQAVATIEIKIDSVLEFLRRDREERIEDRERLNQLERDQIAQRRAVDDLAQRRRKAMKR